VTLREDVLTTTAIMEEVISSGEYVVVERLVAQGYSELQAELLLAFVPLGLGRAVIARLPTDPPLILPDTALIRDFDKGQDLEVPLSNVPEFMTALGLGEEAFLTGIIPRGQLSASCHSVELNLVSEALDGGHEIGGARILPPILLRLAGVPGFGDWYLGVCRSANTSGGDAA
jgi:hypothetical protein